MAGEVDRVGPYLVIHLAGWTLRLLLGVDDAEPRSPCDIEVEAPNGDRYVGVAATLNHLADLMARWHATGECLSGKYVWIKNLVIVRTLSPELLAEVIADLIRTGELGSAMQLVAVPEER